MSDDPSSLARVTGLTDAQIETASLWLRKHLENVACPVCKHETFVFASLVAAPILNVERRTAFGHGSIPMVVVVCERCAYVMQFAAMAMGLFPKPETERANESDDPAATPGDR